MKRTTIATALCALSVAVYGCGDGAEESAPATTSTTTTAGTVPTTLPSRPVVTTPERGFDWQACTYDGVPLHGQVEIVEFGADFLVREVSVNPDLRVEAVEFAPTSCGQWEFVDFGADFTVEFVQVGLGDFTISFVDFNAGT